MICNINIEKLKAFDYEPNSYKGICIGDIICIPEEQSEFLYSNLVKVTGFNIEHDIIHWKALGIFGGIAHSGTYYDQIIGHFYLHE